MKYILFLIPFFTFSQQDVPSQYWLTDSNFEKSINKKVAFGDDETKPVIVEFWAKFNEDNCFAEWNKLKDVLISIRKEFNDVLISIDTYRSEIAKKSINNGADIINDISAGDLDKNMFSII